ncbi:CFEM domain-containing protein [Purpureocillium lavendulum]|uniref:CFEM domain-containing protein n=1 Tax=Purpureocillium lavendulum TaxID=1247861 RepID=A0AB34G3F9_9HYPO|nr:CFEM domain-containing protein [Purpureocillium lavendulum]
MKVTLVVSLAASLVAAQSVGDIPDCAVSCSHIVPVANLCPAAGVVAQKSCVSKLVGGTEIAGCKAADIGCICSNKSFINSIVCCIDETKACTKDELETTLKYAQTLCKASGATLPSTVPTCSASGSPTGSTASSTGTQASGTSSGTATAASGTTAASTSSSTAAAAPFAGGSVGGLAGAVLAMLAL